MRATQARVGGGVKLNATDFQKGGFDAEDAAAAVRLLNADAVDVVEISGGSPGLPNRAKEAPKRASTARREAYFLAFARDIVVVAAMPVMVTGDIRSRAVAEDGRPGVVMVGIAQALAYAPDLPTAGSRPGR